MIYDVMKIKMRKEERGKRKEERGKGDTLYYALNLEHSQINDETMQDRSILIFINWFNHKSHLFLL